MNLYNLFGSSAYPDEPSEGMSAIIDVLKNAESQSDCLRKAYDYITNRYEGSRIKTFARAWELASQSVDEVWSRQGFLHCTNQNYLLAILLIYSGHFTADAIRTKWTTIWLCSPHQYLVVTVDDRDPIAVDPWARHYDIDFGSYATRFNTSVFKRFSE
jgi:hypothetical protein